MPSPGPDPDTSDEDILREFRDRYPPALGTNELATKFDLSQQRMHKRLSDLESAGYVDSRKLGSDRMWWITDKGERHLDSDFGNQ